MNFSVVKDTYNFACTQCGNCCSGDQIVRLNLYDLYRMALFLGLSNTRLLFDKGYVALHSDENESLRPRIVFKSFRSKGKTMRFCPFLQNSLDERGVLKGLCRLHPAHKPLICSLAPLGRVVDFSQSGIKEKFIFVKPAPDCPGVERSVKNKLDDVRLEFRQHLSFEKRYFLLLEKAVHKKWDKAQQMGILYSMETLHPFGQILSEIEKYFSHDKNGS